MQAPFWSQGLNRYSYVFNNPLQWVDPSGFSAEDGKEDSQAEIDAIEEVEKEAGTPPQTETFGDDTITGTAPAKDGQAGDETPEGNGDTTGESAQAGIDPEVPQQQDPVEVNEFESEALNYDADDYGPPTLDEWLSEASEGSSGGGSDSAPTQSSLPAINLGVPGLPWRSFDTPHISVGITLDLTGAIGPGLGSFEATGGVTGLNLQWVSGEGWGVYGVVPQNPENNVGLGAGVSFQVNGAWSAFGGPWTGGFYNTEGGVGPAAGSVFSSSPTYSSSGNNWTGFSFGPSVGPLPGSFLQNETNYVRLY